MAAVRFRPNEGLSRVQVRRRWVSAGASSLRRTFMQQQHARPHLDWLSSSLCTWPRLSPTTPSSRAPQRHAWPWDSMPSITTRQAPLCNGVKGGATVGEARQASTGWVCLQRNLRLLPPWRGVCRSLSLCLANFFSPSLPPRPAAMQAELEGQAALHQPARQGGAVHLPASAGGSPAGCRLLPPPGHHPALPRALAAAHQVAAPPGEGGGLGGGQRVARVAGKQCNKEHVAGLRGTLSAGASITSKVLGCAGLHQGLALAHTQARGYAARPAAEGCTLLCCSVPLQAHPVPCRSRCTRTCLPW